MGTLVSIAFLIAIGVVAYFLWQRGIKGLAAVIEKMKQKEEERFDEYGNERFDLFTYQLQKWVPFGVMCFCAFIIALIILLGSFFTLDAGEAAILIQFGDPYDQATVSGLNSKRFWADTIFWKTRLKALNEKLEGRSKDDMKITMDLTTWWKVKANDLDKLYSDVAKDYETLETSFVIAAIRSAIRDEIAKTSYTELNANREKYAKSITEYVAKKLADKYVIVDKVNIRNVVPPPSVNTAIEEKLKMEQQVQKEEYAIQLAEKKAEVRRKEAKGIADSQRIIQQKLTPLYVQWYAIEMQKELAGSENTTFYFVPMSRNSGIPMVYGMPNK